jgi:pyruvate,water dikinase
MWSFWKKLRQKKEEKEISFQNKFQHFQALLAANDEAHKMMSDLSEMLALGRPFAKNYANSLHRTLFEKTAQIAYHLSEMSNGKYQNLIQKVNDIEALCAKILTPRTYCPEGWDCQSYECDQCPKWPSNQQVGLRIYDMSEINDHLYLAVGSKMSRLGEIRNALQIPVPEGFCIPHRVFETFMMAENLRPQIDEILKPVDFDEISQIQKASQAINTLLAASALPQALEEMILAAYDHAFPANPDVMLAVRSSALGEDSSRYSFAGLHHSELNVGRAQIVPAVLEVLSSKYSPQSLVYRYINGLRDEDMPMSVGCIRIIEATAGGVLFSSDPNNQKPGMIVHAIRGVGSLLVEGQVTPQELLVEPGPTAYLREFTPGRQKFRDVTKATDGLQREEISEELLNEPCLTEAQLTTLVQYAQQIEQHFHSPQDIEWVLDSTGQIFIVQARPLKVKTPSQPAISRTIQVKELDEKYRLIMSGGDAASHGIAWGKVFVINNIKDIKDFPSKGILVAKKNLPEFASLIHKVAAVITDTGSTTGHLSIIARELDIPVLTNTSSGSSLLENGMEVTVYADEKRVYAGKVPELIELAATVIKDEEPFRQSPLYRIWSRIGKMIFKLNLIDPNSNRFSAANCETVHDVIRYAHEISMKLMFSHYENKRFGSVHTYQLRFNVPLDINIIDLGNGLKGNLKRSWVTPDDIVSTPFRALIQGMTTPGIQWSGYLSMDTKGFANLIMGNIVDPNRDRDMGSMSYALVSDKYLNFFSRLGYHFSRLDAFACEEINSNYINFNFRGGASDHQRRSRRAMVIRRILEQLNFTAIREEDNVIANIRKVPEDVIYHLISEIGRLMGAVRNVDVIMVSEAHMDEFIRAFLAGDPAPARRITKNRGEMASNAGKEG